MRDNRTKGALLSLYSVCDICANLDNFWPKQIDGLFFLTLLTPLFVVTFWTSNIGAKQTELNGVLYIRPEVLNKLQNA